MDAEGRVGDLVAPIFDGDGIASRHVWHIGHCVGPVSIVPNIGLLWLALGVLEGKARDGCFLSLAAQ